MADDVVLELQTRIDTLAAVVERLADSTIRMGKRLEAHIKRLEQRIDLVSETADRREPY